MIPANPRLPCGMEVAFAHSIPAMCRLRTEIETQVTHQAPFRFFLLWMTALVIAGAMVSSSARALTLATVALLCSGIALPGAAVAQQFGAADDATADAFRAAAIRFAFRLMTAQRAAT